MWGIMTEEGVSKIASLTCLLLTGQWDQLRSEPPPPLVFYSPEPLSVPHGLSLQQANYNRYFYMAADFQSIKAGVARLLKA